MRYIVIEMNEAFEKFEIDKTHLAKVKQGYIDLIIDTEENKVFRRQISIVSDDEYAWFDMKPYDKRFES